MKDKSRNYDVIIIGAGIVGCMVARFLSRYQLDILLIDKESDVGTGASSANTAIIHPGYDPVPGTLKASLNIRGNQMWDNLAGELNFSFDRRGVFVAAIGKEELPRLDDLHKQGLKNGVWGMAIISGEEMRRREPNINPEVSGALWASTGGIVDPFAATYAAAENAVLNGVTLKLETSFEDFIWKGSRIVGIKTDKGDYYCRWVVNSAGLNSDEVMHKAKVRPEFTITPRKGEYLVFDKAEMVINQVLFPIPTPTTKGILVTATVHGNTIAGPTAHNIEDKEDTSVTRAGLEEVWQGGLKLIPRLDRKHIIATYAGIRSTGNAPCENQSVNYRGDFIIEIPEKVQGLVNLGGIDSPGLTCAPAIAERVIELLKEAGEIFKEKKDWNPIRIPRPRFRELSREEQKKLISNDLRFGRIVCRCETVTEGEIIAEIHAPVPARTYDALKRRTWLGTGRCQGGFDTPRVVEILARELGLSLTEVTKKGVGSNFLSCRTKEIYDEA